ncbi:hypothetical protein ABPG72_004453 [Tetrahymena utriculariae]
MNIPLIPTHLPSVLDKRAENHHHFKENEHQIIDNAIQAIEDDLSLSLRKAYMDRIINLLNCCFKTIGNILEENGLTAFKILARISKPDKNKKDRMKFVVEMSKSRRKVYHLLFSDESYISPQKIGIRH